MHVTFVRVDNETPHIKTFWFRPERPIRYTAGQFTEVHLKHSADDRGERRWFTLSSSPTDELLGITTRIDPVRPSSFKQSLLALTPGTSLTMADPMGDFVLPKNKEIPLLFIAGGIGITPMHSMVRWLHETNQKRTITLYYAAKNIENILFQSLFNQANISFNPILQQPPFGWQGMTGRLSTDFIYALPGAQENALIYLSGPEPMVETFYKGLKSKNIPEHRLVTDYFPGYTEDNI